MHSDTQIELGLIIGLGILAQWMGWRLRVPAILFLLIAGVLAGPVLGWLNPERMLGDALMPIVSIAVALILFEGGLSLKLSEVSAMGRVMWMMVSAGAAITWIGATLLAHYLLEMPLGVALLQGAILVVTGPTVIGPMLRHIRPAGATGPILKWEGILIDPVGALLAVLVFDILVQGQQSAAGVVVLGVIRSLAVGLILGGAGAGMLVLFLRRYWIPEFLETPITFAMVVCAFVASNYLQAESGLITVTLMGLLLANQQQVEVRHVMAFKENLRTLLLSSLFVLLAARLDLESFRLSEPRYWLFLAALILILRPISVWASALGSKLSWKERAFMAWMAPRGIVAAAISSVFALRLEENNFSGGELLTPVTFLAVAGTVTVYGLTSGALARRLGISSGNPEGCVFVGAHPLARKMAAALAKEGIPVLLVDSNWSNITSARQDGLPAHFGDAVSERLLSETDLSEMGRVLALTSNAQVNSLATLHFSETFGRNEVYQLAAGAPAGETAPFGKRREGAPPRHLRGRTLFGKAITYTTLYERLENGGGMKTTKLTKEFGYDAYLREQPEGSVVLFAISSAGRLTVATAEEKLSPGAGARVISLQPGAAKKTLQKKREAAADS